MAKIQNHNGQHGTPEKHGLLTRCSNMILTHPSEVRALLERLQIRPNRTLGQNFLIDANILSILLTAALLNPRDTVLEVGAGLGVLTEWLARRVQRVLAVEKDPRLAAYLRERLRPCSNVTLIEADILDISLDELLRAPVHRIVSNLPYSIAGRFLFAVAEAERTLDKIAVTVQKEVAERIAAKPGSKQYGLLSVMLQLRYHATIVRQISPTCFLPRPEVRSALLTLTARENPLVAAEPALLRSLLKSMFEQRRKQILGLLQRTWRVAGTAAREAMSRADIASMARPEMVSPEQWIRLADALSELPRERFVSPNDPLDA